MIRVVIVDDSRTTRVVLRRILESSGRIEIVGEASGTSEAVSVVQSTRPDLVTMDVNLGEGSDGVELTRTILAAVRTRIVIVSATTKQDTTLSFRALAAGAMDVLAKPSGSDTVDAKRGRDRFLRAISALADVPMVGSKPAPATTSGRRVNAATAAVPGRAIERVLVGASTGGPPLLASIFAQLPAPIPVPVVVVQHISSGFGGSFARWLGTATQHPSHYCDGATRLESGTIHVAGDSAHLRLVTTASLSYGDSAVAHLSTPSVDELFESAVNVDAPGTLAILLTGMGSDGAAGLAALRAKGAFTIAQRPESCVVGSMPRSAIELGAADLVLDPAEIIDVLRRLPVRPIVSRNSVT